MPKRKNILNTDDTNTSQDYTGWSNMPVTQTMPSLPSPGLSPADLLDRTQARQTAAFPQPPPAQAAPSYLSGSLPPANLMGMTGGDFDKMLGSNVAQGNQLQGPAAGLPIGASPQQIAGVLPPPPGGGQMPIPPPPTGGPQRPSQ